MNKYKNVDKMSTYSKITMFHHMRVTEGPPNHEFEVIDPLLETMTYCEKKSITKMYIHDLLRNYVLGVQKVFTAIPEMHFLISNRRLENVTYCMQKRDIVMQMQIK